MVPRWPDLPTPSVREQSGRVQPVLAVNCAKLFYDADNSHLVISYCPTMNEADGFLGTVPALVGGTSQCPVAFSCSVSLAPLLEPLPGC